LGSLFLHSPACRNFGNLISVIHSWFVPAIDDNLGMLGDINGLHILRGHPRRDITCRNFGK
jgi:hypothetical protein